MRAVILCGGSGSRLWPESRESLPKQFIPLIDNKTLLDLTIERFLSLNLKLKPIFICNKKHGFIVKNSMAKYHLEADIFLEPEGKSTCAAIYLAAKHCSYSDYLLIMPSDHLITDNKKFTEEIKQIVMNLSPDKWITLGVKPTKPSEAYGYIKVDKIKNNKLYKTIKFIEKPSSEIAVKLIQDGSYFWNTGMFIGNAKMILNSILKHSPNIALRCDETFDEMKINKKTNEFTFNDDLFSKIPSKSVDYAVMEHETNIYTYLINNNWSDVGSWDSIAELYENQAMNAEAIQINSESNFIRSQNRTIATIGVNDLIIVDTDDAMLISKKGDSEKVKQIVNKLNQEKSILPKQHTFEDRPWGKFENLFHDKHCKVKRLIVFPQKRLSLQYHNFRSEHWLVVTGKANVYLDKNHLILTPGQSIDIPCKSEHYIENKTNEDLIIIETQLGSYFGEDDIIRLDDPYFR